MSIGNMIITNTKITHTGPLGLDDFPTGLKVEVTLDRGKGRDKRDIEKLYLHGDDRIYTQVGTEGILEMYNQASPYSKQSSNPVQISINSDDNIIKSGDTSTAPTTPTNDINNLSRYFGSKNLRNITMASGEISYGSQLIIKTEGSEESTDNPIGSSNNTASSGS
jgi:hypothetical protein